jgi:hypothetical protein
MIMMCLRAISLIFLLGSLPIPAQAADGPTRYEIKLTAPGVIGNTGAACRLVGQVTLWATQPTKIVDAGGKPIGSVELGLAQFAKGARLEGCIPGRLHSSTLSNLSGHFIDVLATPPVFDGRASDRVASAKLALRLASRDGKLIDAFGKHVPLVRVNGDTGRSGMSYEFTLLLIKMRDNSFDLVVHRETTGEQSVPTLADAPRRDSALNWSSVFLSKLANAALDGRPPS